MVYDYANREWEKYLRPHQDTGAAPKECFPAMWPDSNPVTREEFENLKSKYEELLKILEAAKIYDAKTGQPDCETPEKKKDLLVRIESLLERLEQKLDAKV